MKNTYYSYDITKVINIVLFIIHSFGNKVHLLLLNKLLYNADILHLSRYGYLLTRDRYVLMKNGMVPVNTYLIYMKLIEDDNWFRFQYNIHEFFFIRGNYIYCHQKYDSEVLSNSEVSCLFETIRQYKSNGKGLWSKTLVYNISTSDALFNELSLLSIARTIGVNNSMYAYILNCLQTDIFNVRNNVSTTSKSNKLLVLSAITVGAVLKDDYTGYTYIIVGASFRQYMVITTCDNNDIVFDEFFEDLSKSLTTLNTPYGFLPGTILVNCSQLHIITHDQLYKWMSADTGRIIGQIQPTDLEIIFTALHNSSTLSSNIKDELVVYV